jgi:hypothetical protein
MKLFAVYWFSTNSQQADLIHKYDGPARRTRWARAACAERAEVERYSC